MLHKKTCLTDALLNLALTTKQLFMLQTARLFFFLLLFFLSAVHVTAQKMKGTMSFTVSMDNPSKHYYHVILRCEEIKENSLLLKMPAWSPGYYQLLNYAKNVENFKAFDADSNVINWQQPNPNSWKLLTQRTNKIFISYDVKASTQFVAQSYLDENRGYLIPASLFLYIDSQLNRPVTITINPFHSWANVATGLDTIAGLPHTFFAPDFDILYDSPILTGNLEELPPFTVKGKTHRFIGYHLGSFNKDLFMANLKKIVEGASDIIGDIPYDHYTFLAIGPGRGGIEHLNSTTISFDGSQLNTAEGNRRMLSFIAHEYFHHYNVKRIRPVELGPFDYDKGNRTKLLWVAEGLTVYYEYLVLKRKGLFSEEDLLNAFRLNISAFENKPGHLFQSVAQASYETWSDGPFGRTGDEVNKTISYYDKGPALGLLLDFKIRHETRNKRSLDDVMRLLYKKYYQNKKRGFTEDEFRGACENMATMPLPEFFDYVNTVKDIDYPTYFNYAGLQIDTTTKELPGAWLGLSVRERNDSLTIVAADWNSPAWHAGLRVNDKIIEADDLKMSKKSFDEIIATKKAGDKIKLLVIQNNTRATIEILLSKKMEKSFIIGRLPDPDKLQSAILNGWLKN